MWSNYKAVENEYLNESRPSAGEGSFASIFSYNNSKRGDDYGNSSESEMNAAMNREDGRIAIADIYQAWVPVILFFCALTFLFNVFIVVAAYWMRRPLTPTMLFSLSLAAADAIASLNVGLGLILNRHVALTY